MNEPILITSRDNPLLKRLRLLSQDSTAYRKQGQVWLEGDHLCRAMLARGQRPTTAVFTERGWSDAADAMRVACEHRVLVSESLMAGVSGLESPAGMGFLWDLQTRPAPDPAASTVVLDRLQDAGNVGAILRSAAAFGVRQVLALKGTSALWSPKVLRAGQGAHFGLRLVEGLGADDLAALAVPMIATSSHTEHVLHRVSLPSPCAWVMGHEGQGVSPALMARCALTVGIPQPGGEESLNVAAAAAICLYESERQRR